MSLSPSIVARIPGMRAALGLTSPDDMQGSGQMNAEISFLLFVFAGMVGLFNLRGIQPFGPGYEMVALATNLVQHGAYANPNLAMPSGPSAIEPPVYPFLLAVCMKVIRDPGFVLLVVALGTVFANAVTAVLLPRISLAVFQDSRPGIFAAVLWILAAQLFPSWDANLTLTALMLFCLVTSSTIAEKRVGWFGFIAGLIAGLLFLLNPMTLLVFVPWLAHLLIFRRESLKHTSAYVGVVLCTVALVASPWILRNYRIFGSAVVRTGIGLNIYFSNNDCSNTNLLDDLHSGCATVYQPNYNPAEARAFRDLGELNYDRTRLEMAKTWMRSHPDRFVQLTFSRFVAFWFPNTFEYPFKAIVIWIFTLLSIPGLVLMAYRRIPVTAFAVLVLLGYPLVYYVIVSDVRYRYPILWLSLLPAGYLFIWLVRLARERWQSIPA